MDKRDASNNNSSPLHLIQTLPKELQYIIDEDVQTVIANLPSTEEELFLLNQFLLKDRKWFVIFKFNESAYNAEFCFFTKEFISYREEPIETIKSGYNQIYEIAADDMGYFGIDEDLRPSYIDVGGLGDFRILEVLDIVSKEYYALDIVSVWIILNDRFLKHDYANHRHLASKYTIKYLNYMILSFDGVERVFLYLFLDTCLKNFYYGHEDLKDIDFDAEQPVNSEDHLTDEFLGDINNHINLMYIELVSYISKLENPDVTFDGIVDDTQ